MKNTNTSTILIGLEHEIEENPIYHLEPMPGDPWMLASALQKSIRRGEVLRALSAALPLWYQDKTRFWRRLHIICLEDCGIGDVDVLVKTLTACSAAPWRKRVGDLKVGLYLTKLLCLSVKCRVAEEVFTTAERSPCHQHLRLKLSKHNDEALQEIVLDETKSPIERALATWFLAGTNRFPSDYMPYRVGSLDNALSALRSLPTPPYLTEACVGVVSKTPWPLALLTPVILAHLENSHEKFKIEETIMVYDPDVDGLPLYAADFFTRVGKACIRELQKSVPCLKFFDTNQIGFGIFYLDGGLVNKTMTSPELAKIKQGGELADMEASGLCLPEYIALKDCLRESWYKLTDIRQRKIRHYVDGLNA